MTEFLPGYWRMGAGGIAEITEVTDEGIVGRSRAANMIKPDLKWDSRGVFLAPAAPGMYDLVEPVDAADVKGFIPDPGKPRRKTPETK